MARNPARRIQSWPFIETSGIRPFSISLSQSGCRIRCSAQGVAADANGIVYGAEVLSKSIKRYEIKKR